MALEQQTVTRTGDTDWHAYFQDAPDCLLLTALDGRVFAANDAACRLFARSEAEICRVGRAGLVVVDDLARAFMARREASGNARGVLTLMRGDGTTFVGEVASVVVGHPHGSHTVICIHDLTAQRAAQRTLAILAEAGRVLGASLDIEETLQRLTSLLVPRLADLCTVDIVEDHVVRRVAVSHRDPARVEDVRQIRRREALAKKGVDRVLTTGDCELVPVVTDDFLREAAHDEEHLARARALGLRSLVTVPLVAHGRTIGALTLGSTGGVPSYSEADRDLALALAERAALALDNAREHAAAIEALRLRDEVLSVVSHDLRNPLNAISLSAQLIARRSPSDEVDAIQHAVARATHLIHDLLLAAKMDFATIPLERKDERARSLLDEVISLHSVSASLKALELTAAVDEDAVAWVDRHRVVQMLDNLVGNAIKFTASGRVELRARIEKDDLLLEVSDTGIGIPPSDLPHVFDRFWQSARARRAGAGLGLAIARGIARAHGGDISVSSELGSGTRFVATLPMKR
jgi:signal transduction histidine kinase